MTAPTKSTSRWGSFLQQAVAGVESRLDDILAEDSKPKPAPPPASDSVASARVDVGLSPYLNLIGDDANSETSFT